MGDKAPTTTGERFSRRQGPLTGLAVAAGLVWLFVTLADRVLEGATRGLDRALLLAMRHPADPADPLGPVWLESLGRDLTALGGNLILTLVTLVAAVYLLLRARRRLALVVILAAAGSLALNHALKAGFDRPRPDLVPHGAPVYTASFPSGHAMIAASTYMTLAALLARAHRRRRIKAFIVTVGAVLTLGVGSSRVYLGVHWPSDVLAGWMAGIVWAIGCYALALWWERRGADHDR